MVRKREIIIRNDEEGCVLIEWLCKRYTYHSREKWIEHILNGRITLNGENTSDSVTLKSNDKIVYYPEPVIEPYVNKDYSVIYEDIDLLIINKPCDIPCHPGGIYFENTLWYILKQKYEYISLINRLDRETSGVMLIAKNRESAKFYFNKMMERKINKEYLALVHGKFPEKISGKGWLSPDRKSVIRKKRVFIPDENASQPDGAGDPEKEFCNCHLKALTDKDGLSLVECKLETGRTHQIRATLSSLGYPVLGDKIYGLDDSFFFKFINDELTKEDWKNLQLSNQALHSWKTEIPMMNGDTKVFTAEVPESWPISL